MEGDVQSPCAPQAAWYHTGRPPEFRGVGPSRVCILESPCRRPELEPTDTRAAPRPAADAGRAVVRPSPRPPAAAALRAGGAVLAPGSRTGTGAAICSPTPHRSSPTTCCFPGSGCTHRPRPAAWRPAHPGPHREDPPGHPGAAASRRRLQHVCPEGPAELNATVRAYAASQAGRPARRERAPHARAGVHPAPGRHPGGPTADVRINLSLFGLYPRRRHVPTIPPSSCCCPGGSSTRCRLDPRHRRAAVHRPGEAQGARSRRPPGSILDELAAPGKSFRLPRRDRLSAVFSQLDTALKVWEKRAPEMIRGRAARGGEVDARPHARHSDGLGAHLSLDDVLHHGAGRARLSARTIPISSEAIRVFERLADAETEDALLQPCSRRSGTPPSRMFALGEAGVERRRRPARPRCRLAHRAARSGVAATGR